MTSPDYNALVDDIRAVVTKTMRSVEQLRLLFVTSLRLAEEDLADGADGVGTDAQHYTRRGADEIIRSFQDLGLTVEPFFSEMEFLRAVVREENANDPRRRIVYSTAEGGLGPGRRALIPAACNLVGLPILNSGAHASSIVRHKFHGHAVLREAGVRVPDTWQFAHGRWTGGKSPPLGARVIVKPVYESMGIGVGNDSVRTVDSDFDSFINRRSRRFGQPAIVQSFISGDEVGVPVVHIGEAQALPPIAQRRADGCQYGGKAKTFRDEHIHHDLSHLVYAASAVEIEAIREAASLTFDVLDMAGVGRVDCRVDADGRAWVFDVSGEPPPMGDTCWSVAMEQLGFSLPEMLALWVGVCLIDHDLAHESDQNESSQQGISRP